MALYDGNQLPENPTSNFQLIVSLMYTIMMTFYLSLGGFAAWATQRRLTQTPFGKREDGSVNSTPGQLQHPTHYMSDLVQKRNAICRGLLAFIPAAFSLAHLYTNTLHSSSLYAASNVLFGALMGYAAFVMGKTLQQLVVESDRMDTTKAVYESLYMLANAFDRLSKHKPCTPVVPKIFHQVEDAQDPTTEGCIGITKKLLWDAKMPAWRSPWVLFNVFLAIGAQDDARTWPMFSAWLRRFQVSNLTVTLPSSATMRGEVCEFLLCPAWLKALLPSCALRHLGGREDLQHRSWLTHAAYAYWLYSQNKRVRTIAGSMVVHQGVGDEMLLAVCRSHKLYYTAAAYINTLTTHVVTELKDITLARELDVEFITKTGKAIKLSTLTTCLDRIFHPEQAHKLSMVCERYVCRLTPAFASLCLSTTSLVPQLFHCWAVMFGEQLSTVPWLSDPGYWCRLWLAYMHVVLVGVDLLRMHNNKAYFKDCQNAAGFLSILTPAEESAGKLAQRLLQEQQAVTPSMMIRPAVPTLQELVQHLATSASAAVAIGAAETEPKDPRPDYGVLQGLSDADLYALASLVAVLLLGYRMKAEGALDRQRAHFAQEPTAAARVVLTGASLAQYDALQAANVKLSWIGTYIDTHVKAGRSDVGDRTTYGDYLFTRWQLVSSHSSLPAIVEGVECVSAADWVQSVMGPLVTWVFLSALAAAVVATLACSNGVFLVAVSGFVQALCAWAMLLYLDQIPHNSDFTGSPFGPPMPLIRVLTGLCAAVLWLCELMLRPVWIVMQGMSILLPPSWWLSYVIRCVEKCCAHPTHATGPVKHRVHTFEGQLLGIQPSNNLRQAEQDDLMEQGPKQMPHEPVEEDPCLLVSDQLMFGLAVLWMVVATAGILLWLRPWLTTVEAVSEWVVWACTMLMWVAFVAVPGFTWFWCCSQRDTPTIKAAKTVVWMAWMFGILVLGCAVFAWWLVPRMTTIEKPATQNVMAWVPWLLTLLVGGWPYIAWFLFSVTVAVVLSALGLFGQHCLWFVNHCWWLLRPILCSITPASWWWHASVTPATDTAAAAVAAAVAVAATSHQAFRAAKEAFRDLGYDDPVYAKQQLPGFKARLREMEEACEDLTNQASGNTSWSPGQPYTRAKSVLEATMAAEEAAINQSAAGAAKFMGYEPDDADPVLPGPARQRPVARPADRHADVGVQEALTGLHLLRNIRHEATKLLLCLACKRITLQSCFEYERRHFYRDRINPGNVAVKFIAPFFFYAFLAAVVLAGWQEPFYAGPGMCLGRCNNRTDCMAEQNIGMPWLDNPLGRLASLDETKAGALKDAPACPGTGSLVVPPPPRHPGAGLHKGRQCAWLAAVYKVTVLKPQAVYSRTHPGSILCRCDVRLVNMLADMSANNLTLNGTAVPAVWLIMHGHGGSADITPSQVGNKVWGYTNNTGYASFTSTPFNSSAAHGCNLTVLEAEITKFVVHSSSKLHNAATWRAAAAPGALPHH